MMTPMNEPGFTVETPSSEYYIYSSKKEYIRRTDLTWRDLMYAIDNFNASIGNEYTFEPMHVSGGAIGVQLSDDSWIQMRFKNPQGQKEVQWPSVCCSFDIAEDDWPIFESKLHLNMEFYWKSLNCQWSQSKCDEYEQKLLAFLGFKQPPPPPRIPKRSHTGEYMCQFCDYSSKQRLAVEYHENLHTGERPFKCTSCDHASATPGALKSHIKSIHSEEGVRRKKKKEERVSKFLMENDIPFEREKQIEFNCLDSDGKRARIDFVIPRPWGYILLEVDEDQHKFYNYDVSCEVRRMMDIVGSIRTNDESKLLFIRYNPDSFSVDDQKQKVPVADRESTLLELISHYEPGLDVAIQYLYYDTVEDLPTFFYEYAFQPVRDLLV